LIAVGAAGCRKVVTTVSAPAVAKTDASTTIDAPPAALVLHLTHAWQLVEDGGHDLQAEIQAGRALAWMSTDAERRVSHDGGVTWFTLPGAPQGPLYLDRRSGGLTAWIKQEGKPPLLVTNDGGATFKPVDATPSEIELTRIDPFDGTLYGAGPKSLSAHVGGFYWSAPTTTGLSWSRCADLDPSLASVGGTEDIVDAIGGEIFLSTDHPEDSSSTLTAAACGAAITSPVPVPDVRALAMVEVDPGHPGVVFANDAELGTEMSCKLLRSTDSGQTWRPVFVSPTDEIIKTAAGTVDTCTDFVGLPAFDPRHPDSLYVPVGGARLVYSSDDGVTFTDPGLVLPAAPFTITVAGGAMFMQTSKGLLFARADDPTP
jgi:hypothetical protein